ncbi:MAG: hypothetical protein CME71_00690 [Halobacteriovorax sp.]|nr:hypothetical protein [Halobacteriovorax sp.]
MAMKKIPENHLLNEIYVPESGKGFKRWLAVIALFFITFLLTFPFEKTIIAQVEKAINSQRACPISYESVSLTWFAPGLDFEKPVISGNCFQRPGSDLPLNNMALSFAGPNFSPIGVRFKVLIESENSRLEAYPAVGIGEQVVRITDTTIGEDIFAALTGMNIIASSLSVDGLITMAENQISSAKFKVESKRFKTRSTNIKGFDLMAMDLGNFVLLAEMDAAAKLFVEKLSFGEANSTLAGNFKGNITLNRFNMLYSNADLTGEVRFSEELTNAIPLINIFIQGKQPIDGFYKLEIKGPLGQTRPNFL